MLSTSGVIVAVFGILIFAASCWGVAAPRRLLRTVEGMMASGIGMPFAVGVRLILGAALIAAAPGSLTPRIFVIVGGFSITAAVVLPFIGRENVSRLVQWLEIWPSYVLRSWLVFGALFGAYLAYAVDWTIAEVM